MTSRSEAPNRALSPSRWPCNSRNRAFVAISIGLLAAAAIYSSQQPPGVPITDWDEIWVGSRALLQGREPYAVIDSLFRGGRFEYPLIYPGTSLVVTAPFALAPHAIALGLWSGVGASGLAWVLTRRGWWGLFGLGSAAYFHAFMLAQWSPLLTGAIAVPWLGFLWAAKPTIGLPLLIGWPSKPALLGGLGLLALSLLILPGWPQAIAARAHTAPHVLPIILRPGGVLLLLALLRWRLPEARLLAALAVIPQTTVPYEMVPLLLIPRSARQMVLFAGLTVAAFWLAGHFQPPQSHTDLPGTIVRHWPYWLLLVYLPALLMVLRYPKSQQASWWSRPSRTSEGRAP